MTSGSPYGKLKPLTRGPKFLRTWLNDLLEAGKASVPLPGAGTTINQTRDGRSINASGGTAGKLPAAPSSGSHVLTAAGGQYTWVAAPASGNHVLTVQAGVFVFEQIEDC